MRNKILPLLLIPIAFNTMLNVEDNRNGLVTPLADSQLNIMRFNEQYIEIQNNIKKEEIEKRRKEIMDESVNTIIEKEVKGVNYNPYDLREPSNLSEEQIHQILEGNSLQTLSRAYYWYEQEYGINALLLMALNREESGNGESSLAMSHNNLGGVKNRYGDYAYFNDWGESLEEIARLLSEEYLDKDGLYHNGYSIWDVNIKYCEQMNWADKLNDIVYEMINKLEEM